MLVNVDICLTCSPPPFFFTPWNGLLGEWATIRFNFFVCALGKCTTIWSKSWIRFKKKKIYFSVEISVYFSLRQILIYKKRKKIMKEKIVPRYGQKMSTHQIWLISAETLITLTQTIGTKRTYFQRNTFLNRLQNWYIHRRVSTFFFTHEWSTFLLPIL